MRTPFPRSLLVSSALVMLGAPLAHAQEPDEEVGAEAVVLDEISVTATRAERKTQDVPQSISVISAKEIEDQRMFNLKDGLEGTPGVQIQSENAGYDARLIIRGAGLKARYGIREIMVLRDGVPITDPDSFTNLDYVDTQDIEQIEVVKGPGSIYASGSAGGTIQILSKSVFDLDNRFRAGGGNLGQILGHARVGGMVTDSQALSLSATHKQTDNDWREWNEFESHNIGLKHGVFIGESGVLESEIAFTEADLQLPGSLDETEFRKYEDTGTQDQDQIDSPWRHSGRYSHVFAGNVRYEHEFGDFTLKPRVYGRWWEHYHPVTGFINVSENNYVFGGDLEGELRHSLGGRHAVLVAGVTARRDISEDAKKYTYKNPQTVLVDPDGPWGPSPAVNVIVATTNDDTDQLAKVQDAYNTLYGLFLQESVNITDNLLLDVGFRLDQSEFDIAETEYIGFNYATNSYDDHSNAPTRATATPSFTLFSPKVGLSWEVVDGFSLYGSVAQAGQVPSSSEITSNPDLEAAIATNYEIGAKARYAQLTLDVAAYYSLVEDEIVQQRQNGESIYLNAGETEKIGIEVSAAVEVTEGLSIGGGYAYSNYEFVEFSEIVYGGGPPRNVSRAGNTLPFIPEHQYSLFASYRHPGGFQVRVQSRTWGEYWMDNANTEKYEGYEFVTDVMVGYETGPHTFALNVDNVFNQHYAVEATKDLSGDKSYDTAPPLTFLVSYRYSF